MKERLLALLQCAIRDLIENDQNLLSVPNEVEILEYSVEREKLERKLHEVCINHRLAYYLEQHLPEYGLSEYQVDIEYNRYYRNAKMVIVGEEELSTRPDIIVHKRMSSAEYANLLVIEAKKESTSAHDLQKLRGFISDKKYRYTAGAAISYNGFNPVIFRFITSESEVKYSEPMELEAGER